MIVADSLLDFIRSLPSQCKHHDNSGSDETACMSGGGFLGTDPGILTYCPQFSGYLGGSSVPIR